MTDSFEKIGEYEIHPDASVWPMLPHDELCKLAESIKRDGQLSPITMSPDGRLVVDGRNRLAAALMAGVLPRFEHMDPDATIRDIRELIWNRNGARRHMTTEQRAEVARLMRERAKVSADTLTIEEAARAAGVSIITVKRMKALAERRPDLHEKVLARELSISAAYTELMGHEPTADPLPDHIAVPTEPAPAPEPRQARTRTRETLPAPVAASRPPAPIQRPAPLEGELIPPAPPASEEVPSTAPYWAEKLQEARAERDKAFADRERAEKLLQESERARAVLTKGLQDLQARMDRIEGAPTPPPEKPKTTGRRVF